MYKIVRRMEMAGGEIVLNEIEAPKIARVAERRDLTLGRMVDGRRLVEKGLAAGDRLVVGGVQRIYYPGMPVNPRPVVAAAVQPTPAAAQ